MIALVAFVLLCGVVGIPLGAVLVVGALATPPKPKPTGLDLGRVVR